MNSYEQLVDAVLRAVREQQAKGLAVKLKIRVNPDMHARVIKSMPMSLVSNRKVLRNSIAGFPYEVTNKVKGYVIEYKSSGWVV